jgi:hypothetical protein
MSAITWGNVTDQAAELATFTNTNAQTVLLAYANSIIVVDGEDGKKTNLARVYWVAHVVTVLRNRGMAGARTAQSSGGVSESFSPLQLSRIGEFGATSYGILYAMIVANSAVRAGKLLNKIVVGPGVDGTFGRGSGWGSGGGYGY